MNLYKLHSEPESLKLYDKAHNNIPFLVWDKYKNNPNELKRREDVIAKSTKFSFLYALEVLNRSFIKGEDAISKDAEYSFKYAYYVLNSPFPKGEDVIAKNSMFAYKVFMRSSRIFIP